MEAVYTSLTQIMKEDYEFLQKFYSSNLATSSGDVAPAPTVAAPTTVVKKKVAKKSTPVAAVAVAAAAAPALQEEEEAPRIRADTKVRVVKKPTDPQDLPAAPAPVTVAQPSVQPEAQPFVHAESGLRNPQEQKKWQKEQEDKKMRDLRATGVNPASLLTEANLRKWVEEEKKTFAFIAREYVGLSDGVVAAEAKKYGLQSDTSKRRAMIAANKART
jgi:type IV secretory pathway VirB10-like protein